MNEESLAILGFKIIKLEECKMATVGQSLTAPEAGWKRFDNVASEFLYLGDNWTVLNKSDAAFYNGGIKYTSNISDKIIFKFYGTKLRIITQPYTSRSNRINVSIDGTINETYSLYSSTATNQRLNYEKTDLELKIHTVIITNEATNSGILVWDAIDIDSTGYLMTVILLNLSSVAGDSQVTLNWDAVTGATGYNVKRSTTAGGPYTTIASNVSGTSYVDSDVVNGITYYYVVTAITADGENDNSNEASATPQAAVTPPATGDRLLRVTVIDSSERDYQMSAADIDAFVNWYMKHTSADTAGYMLTKKVGTQSSKEYLAFDKIISFEVIPIA